MVAYLEVLTASIWQSEDALRKFTADASRVRADCGLISLEKRTYRLLYCTHGEIVRMNRNCPLMKASQFEFGSRATEALAAKTPSDVDRFLPELRSALEEHVRLARHSLEAQVVAITAMDAAFLERPDQIENSQTAHHSNELHYQMHHS